MNKKIVVISLLALALCGIVGQVANATFAHVSSSPAASGEYDFYGTATDGQDAFYVASSTNPPTLVKFAGASNARTGALTLTGLSSNDGGITAYGGNIFVGDCNDPASIIKVSASTLTVMGSILTLNSGVGEGCIYGMVNDGSTYLYAASYGDGIIVKVKMSDLTRVSATPLADGYLYAVAIDGAHIYVALDDGSSSGKQITRVVLSTFLEDSAIKFESGETDAYAVATDSTASACTYVYAGMNTYPGIIVKVSCSPFTRVSALVVHSANDINDLAFDTAFGMLYALTDSSPFAVVQVRISDFSVVATVVSDVNDGYANFMRRAGDNTLFVGTTGNPAQSVKFSIDAPPPRPNTTAAPLSVGALESKIVVAVVVALMSVVFAMA